MPNYFFQLIAVSIFSIAIGILHWQYNSKEKSEYTKSEGTLTYYAKEYLNYPANDPGDYRYIKIDNYPYMFEVYKPNSFPSDRDLDDLRIGDQIEVYYYETNDTYKRQINRFSKYIDSNGASYFISDDFQKNGGLFLVGLGILIAITAVILKNKRIIQ